MIRGPGIEDFFIVKDFMGENKTFRMFRYVVFNFGGKGGGTVKSRGSPVAMWAANILIHMKSPKASWE